MHVRQPAVVKSGKSERLFTPSFVFAALATLALSLSGFLFVHLPGFLRQFGAAEAEIGRVMSAEAIGAIVAFPLVGWLMDTRGRRVVILSGSVVYLVVVGLYLFIQSLGSHVYVVRVLHGVAHTMWYTGLFTYGADLVPERRRTQGLAIFGISGLVTIGLGALFGDLILAYATYRELFLGSLGFAVLGVLLCLPLRDVGHAAEHGERSSRGALAVARQPNLVSVWIVACAFFMSLGALFSFLKTFVSSVGTGSVGGFFMAYTLIAVLLRVFAGWIPDRVGAKRMLAVALSSSALGFCILAFAQSSMHVIVAGLLCGIGHGYTYPILFSLVIERAKRRERGSAMALYVSIDWLGLLIAGPLFGYIIEYAGYDYAFAGLALLLAVGIGLFYTVDRQNTLSTRRQGA